MIDTQGLSTEQGRAFEAHCATWLGLCWGCRVKGPKRLPELGIEIDFVISTPAGRFFVECKGSWRGNRPGAQRTDTMKKALANAFLLDAARRLGGDYPPFIILASHLPEKGHASAMLDVALKSGAVAAAFEFDRDINEIERFLGYEFDETSAEWAND
jgi:hypothetical protein